MKMLTSTIITVFIFVFFLSLAPAKGQQSKTFSFNKKYFEAGVSNGTSHFVGDVGKTASAGYTGGIYLSRRLTPMISVRAGIDYTRLQGDDAKVSPNKDLDRYIKNQHFRNDVFSFSVEGVLDLIPHYGFSATRQTVVPYAVTGVSAYIHNPKVQGVEAITSSTGEFGEIIDESKTRTDEWVNAGDLQTEGVNYSKLGIAVPAGLGVRIAVSKKINLSVETMYNFTFSDYIDDAAGQYIDFAPGDENINTRRLYSNRTAENFVERDLFNVLDQNGLSVVPYTYSDGTQYYAVEGYSHEKGADRRGNSNNNDSFFTVRAKLGFVFGGKSLRPKL